MTRSHLSRLTDPTTMLAMVERLREGIYITSSSGEILDANPAFLEMFGVSSIEELAQYTAEDLLVDPLARANEREILERSGSVRDFELHIRTPDGRERHVLDTAYAITDPVTRETLYHGILVDITRLKEMEHQLRSQAIRDPLTGAFNRRMLVELAQQLDSSPAPWGVVVIDLDRFKLYNDQYGHQAGDEILVKTSRFLMREVRSQDAVIRLGGDEFMLFLSDAGSEVTNRVGERLRRQGPHEAPAPFSLGWAVRQDAEPLEKTIGRADRKLIQVRIEDRKYPVTRQ